MLRTTLFGLVVFAVLSCGARPERSVGEESPAPVEVLPKEVELPLQGEVAMEVEELPSEIEVPVVDDSSKSGTMPEPAKVSDAGQEELPQPEEVIALDGVSPPPTPQPVEAQPSAGETLPAEEPTVLEPELLTEPAPRVAVPAVLRLSAFAAGDPAHHHFLTWSRGRAGPKALLETLTSDETVLDALIELGGKPGDNLREEAWTKRADRAHPAPDERARGSLLEVRLLLPDGRRVAVEDLVTDLDENGLEWVLAGNRDLIDVWRSGCVMCLQSCPGSKIANRSATMRDLHDGRARYVPSELAKKLGEGARVVVEIAVTKEQR